MARKKLDPKRRAKPAPSDDTIYCLKVTLNYITPAIWRRIETPNCTLWTLHNIIQISMPWEHSHLWDFAITRTERYGMEKDEFNTDTADRIRLSDLAARGVKRIVYTYDFGDSWEHIITFEKSATREPEAKYPRCVAGERAAPPEDCGGVPGYEYLLEILANPKHEEYAERVEWLGEEYDPEAFDIDGINAYLQKLKIK